VSDEEARLREYLERERTHGDWPEQLQREHPDLFPVHAQEEDDPADPKAVRRLLLVTGSIVVALLVAEVTDTVVGNAWLLALLVAMAGMSFYYGFLYRHHVVRY
ncbi:MAG: hypothetical protein GWN71_35910, partial [Gammaproteobacteria bacterium]|nr:hypothetical protein [Gemmatimonadota bacterium]NIU78748.1 hypothetical protein [Gammaproteobacteria bacterium]NIX24324.1 hypothetical protein [Actinomycetota bacterium]